MDVEDWSDFEQMIESDEDQFCVFCVGMLVVQFQVLLVEVQFYF